jgi:LysM repeat protein
VTQIPQGAKITQKYNTYQQQGAHAFPVEPEGGIQQLSKIPLSQVPKGANIVQAPTPAGNLYKNLPAAPALEEEDQPIDMDLVNQIYRNNRDIIGDNPNLIEPKTMIDLPDGTPYEIQPGDTLSKIARKIPTLKAPVLPIDPQAAAPTWMDKLKKAGAGLMAGELPSRAIPNAFPSLKKRAPAVNAAPVAVPVPIVKAPPEMVAPADSMDPGEEIVVKSKVKPHLPPRTPSPQPFMPAGANPERPKEPHVPTPKEPTIIDKAGDKIGQAYHWLADLVKGRESGNDYNIGYHYPPGSGDAGPNNRKTTAYGAYGLTQAYIDNARKLDPTLDKPIDKWTAADQDHAFRLGTAANVKRMSALGVDLAKHPEAPSIAHALGPDGAADYFKTGKFSQEAIDQNGGEKKLRAIIAQRTKDAQAALELQNKEKAKQKTKESAVAETIQTVKVMLETATTRDDVRHIKDYIDRQYTRHGLTDSVSFAQRNHLVERVIDITGKRLLA